MYINSIYFEDKLFNITVEETSFSDLNLLVGASGAGKTMIINAISNLKEISNGNSGFPGAKWRIDFNNSSGKRILWSGEMEKTTLPAKILSDLKGENNNRFINEEIFLNGKLLAARDKDNYTIEGKTDTVSPAMSVLAASESKKLTNIGMEFNKIIFSDNSPQYDFRAGKFSIPQTLVKSNRKYTLEEIKKANISTPGKLFLAYKYEPETFAHIKERFIEIFGFVEDIKIEPYFIPELPVENAVLKEQPVIQIKEKYSNEWVHEIYISSGMSRTLLKLAEIELADDNTVIIIDELENSLGTNSLEVLVDEIKYSYSDIQYIITSHHPYIIQNLDSATWKLVKRIKNRITTLTAEHAGIGLSKHDQFFELLNTEDYRTGIEKE